MAGGPDYENEKEESQKPSRIGRRAFLGRVRLILYLLQPKHL